MIRCTTSIPAKNLKKTKTTYPVFTPACMHLGSKVHQPRDLDEEDQEDDDDGNLEPLPPYEGRRSSLRHLSLSWGSRSSCLPHRSVSGGAACTPSALSRRNLGTYFPELDAAAAAAGAATTGSEGRGPETGSVGRDGGSAVFPSRASLLNLSLSSNSLSLCLCLSAIASSFAFRSASSFFRLSSSARLKDQGNSEPPSQFRLVDPTGLLANSTTLKHCFTRSLFFGYHFIKCS